jgi:hypothetical protein
VRHGIIWGRLPYARDPIPKQSRLLSDVAEAVRHGMSQLSVYGFRPLRFVMGYVAMIRPGL